MSLIKTIANSNIKILGKASFSKSLDRDIITIWIGDVSVPTSYSYIGGIISQYKKQLIIDDITLLQIFSSTGNNVGGSVHLNGAISLTNLEIQQAGLTHIDLTGCTSLTELNLSNNYLTSIIGLSELTALTLLNISANPLTTSALNLNGLNSLETVNANQCEVEAVMLNNCTSLLNVDFSSCASLISFSAENSYNIRTLNLSNSNNITTIATDTGSWNYANYINLSGCNLTPANLNIILGNLASAMSSTNSGGTLIIGGNSKDETTFGHIATIQANGWIVFENPAPSILWSGWTSKPSFSSDPAERAGVNWSEDGINLMVAPANALNSFGSSSSVGGTLDATNFTNLTSLSLSNTSLTSLVVSGLTNLNLLSCESCQLSTLNLSGLSNLLQLSLYGNPLSALDLSGLTKLSYLAIGNNPFTTLDFSDLTDLTRFFANTNNLTTMDFSNNTKLLSIQANASSQLTTMNVSGLTNLEQLSCYYSSNLNSLDLSGLVSLWYLDITGNLMTSLNLAGAININKLYAHGNRFSESVVNNILITIDGFATSSGYIIINGTQNAAPTGDGLTAKLNLQSRGWTVSTN